MPKLSNRERILAEGLRVVHERGYGGASVRDIVQAAGVPQGSFTNHFASKEAFGLEILERYFANSRKVIRTTLHNESLAPLDRLRAYIEASKRHLGQDGMRNGCLFGNFCAEVVDRSEGIRHRLVEIFAEVQGAVATCLRAAVAAGELPAGTACDDVAGLVVASLQGATLLAKAERSPGPLERFERMLFSTILPRENEACGG